MSSKLDCVENVDEKLAAWVGAGHSLKRMAGELRRLGVKVTDMTVQRRLRSLGLTTKNAPIAEKTGAGAWLSQYRDEIVGMADAGSTYAEIWDRLAAAHPTQPQFQRDLGRDAKTSAIAAWVHAERKRCAHQRRSSLLEAFPTSGAIAPQYVVMQAPGGATRRPQRAPAATSVGQLVRPVAPQVPDASATSSVRSGEVSAGATGELRFDIEARRRETAALQQSQRARENAATSEGDKAKAAKLRERFKTS